MTFDAVVAGKARGCDVVIVDTAGRLATQAHLMEELKKIKRVIGKAEAGAPHEVLLVIDGNTGQNALAQVQAFDEALQLTGLVITKLDGTAKGGVLAAIALWSRSRSEPLPVYFVGVGEKLADLQTFRAREFAAALVELSARSALLDRRQLGGDRVELVEPRRRARLAHLDHFALRPVAVGVGERIDRRAAFDDGVAHARLDHRGVAERSLAEFRGADHGRSGGCQRGRGFLPMPAGTAGAFGRSFSRAASIVGSFSSFQTWSGILAAFRARATRSRRTWILSSSCSIGGRTSTTATTCEVTSQTTKSTHWLPSRRIHSA